MWNGSFFQRTTLRDLGLRVQLGHALGDSCPTLLAANVTFRVIHSNGIHQVAVDRCRCHGAADFYEQLLHINWWPATPLNSKTAATFEVLRHFHLLNLQGKVTGYSFYQALEYQTDNTGLNIPPVSSLALPFIFTRLKWKKDRLNTFMLMVREWRHMKMLKRAGRAYDPGGIAAMTPGSLAIPCRACPLPQVNLPECWENAPPERA